MIDCIVQYAGEPTPAMFQGKIIDPRTNKDYWLFVLYHTSEDDNQAYLGTVFLWDFELKDIQWLGSVPEGF